MIEQQISEIIDKLIQGTKLKKIKWQRTGRETEFKVTLGSSSVSTDKWMLDSGDECVDFTLWNKNGDIAKRIAFEDNEEEAEDYKKLFEFYSLVKNSYYQVDETIEDILCHLDF